MRGETLLTLLRPGVKVIGILHRAPDPPKHPVYSGAYAITPSAQAQTLATAGLVMEENVRIGAIALREEANQFGGITATIGETGGQDGV